MDQQSLMPDQPKMHPTIPATTAGQKARKLAGFCFWSAFGGLILVFAAAAIIELQESHHPRFLIMVVVTALCLWLTGLICGVMALRNIKQAGWNRGSLRAAVGSVLNVVLIGLGVWLLAIVHEGFKDSAISAKVRQDFNRQATEAIAEYDRSVAGLTNPPVLNLSEVKTKADLLQRENRVRDYIAACKALEEFWLNSVKRFDEELKLKGVSEFGRKNSVNDFIEASGLNNPLALPTHRNAVLIGEARLKLLQTLEKDWGVWYWKQETGNIEFKDEHARSDYQVAFEKLKKLRTEGKDLSKRWEEWGK
jgi:hypothetical protein